MSRRRIHVGPVLLWLYSLLWLAALVGLLLTAIPPWIWVVGYVFILLAAPAVDDLFMSYRKYASQWRTHNDDSAATESGSRCGA